MTEERRNKAAKTIESTCAIHEALPPHPLNPKMARTSAPNHRITDHSAKKR
jgi:hypothetical protein